MVFIAIKNKFIINNPTLLHMYKRPGLFIPVLLTITNKMNGRAPYGARPFYRRNGGFSALSLNYLRGFLMFACAAASLAMGTR